MVKGKFGKTSKYYAIDCSFFNISLFAENELLCFTLFQNIALKLDSDLPKKIFFFIRFNDSPSKLMKNAFYFNLKALLDLKIFTFLFRYFEHVEKMA